MSEIIDQSLQKMARGTGIVFIGTIAGMLLTFLGRILVARNFTQAEYGIFSLGLTLFGIFVEISLLGFQDGIARQISYYRGKNNSLMVRGVIISSIQLVLVASIILAIILFFTSDVLSTWVFHDPLLAAPLRVLALAIPFLAMISIWVCIFRGFEGVKENIYFQHLLRTALFPSFLIPVILLQLPFVNAIYAFTASIIVTWAVFTFYTVRRVPLSFGGIRGIFTIHNLARKDLLLFSAPLFGAFIMDQVLNWTDTLMLGYFTTSDTVGLYNAAAPIARIIVTFMFSSHFLLIPIMAKLYSQNLMTELKINYQVLTKWILFAMLPLFFTFVFLPEAVLGFLFGVNYVEASLPLQILSICFVIHVVLGPSGAALVSMGRTRFAMMASVIGAVLSIVFNAILIPRWGINGAAIATAIALLSVHGLYSLRFYQVSRVHPFTRNYVTFLLVSSLVIVLISVFTRGFFSSNLLLLLSYPVIMMVVCGAVLLLSRSIDKEDIMLLLTMEKSAGLNLAPIKNILKRFI